MSDNSREYHRSEYNTRVLLLQMAHAPFKRYRLGCTLTMSGYSTDCSYHVFLYSNAQGTAIYVSCEVGCQRDQVPAQQLR